MMVQVPEIRNIDGQGGGSKMNERRLKSFFSALGNLEQLKLGLKTTTLMDVVLSLRIARSELPSMRSLDIQVPVEWKKPFDSKIYRYLNEYPALCRLSISTDGEEKFASSSKGGAKLPKITELDLNGANFDNSKTLSFLQNFPRLSSLTLNTLTSHTTDYRLLVSVLPISLTSLTLLTRAFYDGYSKPCDEYLPRLVNLERLYFGEGTFSQGVINSLRKLSKLKTLGFGKGATLPPSKLEELILGPDRIPALDKVIFDQVEGKRGWSILKASDGFISHPEWEKSPWYGGPGWIVPQWGRDGAFYEEAIKKLVDRIKLAEIKVEGTTLEAFGVFDDWGIDSSSCIIAKGFLTMDFDECRETFGDEFVDGELLVGFESEMGCMCGECDY
jgi:hypothetical protein